MDKHVNRVTGEVFYTYAKIFKGGYSMFLEDQEITNTAKVILSYMLAKGKNGVWLGTQKFLAGKLHIQPNNLSKYIRQMTEKGYIARVDVYGASGYQVNPELGK
jgi:DNA-binding MarR family transcriptional regulator